MEGDRGAERGEGFVVGGVLVGACSVRVAVIVGEEHGGAEGGGPLKDLGANVVEKGIGTPSTKEHYVGWGMAS
jgi:hypothetical protein